MSVYDAIMVLSRELIVSGGTVQVLLSPDKLAEFQSRMPSSELKLECWKATTEKPGFYTFGNVSIGLEGFAE